MSAEAYESLAELKAALEARDGDGADLALAKLLSLPLTPEMRATAGDLAQHLLFGDIKKASEVTDALLERG
jgi:hypothetical protein